MRIAHDYRGHREMPEKSVQDSFIKQALYWVIVFLALISVICIGIILLHWTINSRVF
jgi:hypothetical protein